MQSPSWLQRPWVGQFAKFLVVGSLGVLVNLAVFELCLWAFRLHYLAASSIAFVVAVTSNYYWNRRWTFRSVSGAGVQYLQFVLVCLVGLGVNLAVLALCVERLNFSEVLGQLTGIASATLFNFAASKLWVFSHRGSSNTATEI